MIYLDNAATTKMFEECASIYKEYACTDFFNPSTNYIQGVAISKKLDEVRELILNRLGANKGDIIFTGGATESNNLAIRGSLRNGWEHVFSIGEHPSVYSLAKTLEDEAIVKIVALGENGQIDYDFLEKSLSIKTRLISVMHVSNETGAINDIKRISLIRDKICPKALLHVDGVQAFCKLNFSVDDLGIDLYTISAHKFHGPKGVGALYVKNKQTLKNIIYGGGQEFGLRSGTENVAGIMAMACAIEKINVDENYKKVTNLNSLFKKGLNNDKSVKILNVNGSPYIISLSFKDVNGETLMRALEKDVIVGMGSACSTKKSGNRILENIGYDKNTIKTSLRVSFNAYMSEEEICKAVELILKKYKEIWEKVK